MRIAVLILALFLFACDQGGGNSDPSDLSWEQIEKDSEGKTVQLMMWQGDVYINAYMQDYVVPKVKELHGIDLQISSGQGNQIVNTLLTELEAGKNESQLDLVWINGETFYQLRQIEALFGPWLDKLPNAEYLDLDNPFIGRDFQQDIEGYECPWGNVQLSIIYHSDLVSSPPADMKAFAEFIRANPGVFTIPSEFTGMTLLKSWLIALAGGEGSLDGPFSEEKYFEPSQMLFDYLSSMRGYWWNEGQDVPSSLAQVHQLFANKELWFTMSNNDGEADNKVLQGLFPETARSFVFESGTIQNSHYMGIPALSANKEAAMVVANFLISPEAQFGKMQPSVWGDGTVLNISGLPADWQEQFANIPGRERALPRSSIDTYALQEIDPEYMIRLYDDYREYIANW